ncbi:MAG TPA: nucleotidyl transferase AbiEii/AbiGii toxin family protein [Candidatus Bathyarchaeia archaeon]
MRFQIGPLEKAFRLAAFLAELASHPFLKDRLVLKGGTNLNLFHGTMERLSVDADLNYIGQVGTDGMQAERPEICAGIEALSKELGYRFSIEKDEHALRTYHLRFRGVGGNEDLIKLDLNFLERVPVLLPIERIPPPSLLEVDGPPVPCLQLIEVAGSKLATLLLRGASRDLFDLSSLRRMPVDWTFARKIALFHGFLDHVRLRNLDPSRVKDITERDFNRGLRNLLRKGQSMHLEDLKEAATPLVDSVFPLQPTEERCREDLARGQWNPAFLFGNLPFNPVIQDHPGMLWRLQHPEARLPS